MEIAEFQTLKRQALTRRANKLIEWLHRPEYAIYVDENSITHLIKLIDLIIWALEYSLPDDEWKYFKHRFYKARSKAVEIVENPEQQKDNYYIAVPAVIDTLRSYSEYISNNI